MFNRLIINFTIDKKWKTHQKIKKTKTTIIRNDILVRPIKHVERLWITRKDDAAYLGTSVDLIKSLNLSDELRFA